MDSKVYSKLIKIANDLDNMGFFKEANSVDKIARNVISYESPLTVPEPVGNYKQDIETYKELLFKDINDPKPAAEFLRKVMDKGYLSPQESFAFNVQTERLGKLRKFTPEDRKKINDLLYSKVHDYKVDESGIGSDEFNKRWDKTKFTKDLNSPSLDTYNILRSRFITPSNQK